MEAHKTKPANGRKKPRARLKGRQPEGTALREVSNLLPSKLARDRLIEYLHILQDTYGHLSAHHLRALAEIMNLPQIEVYEVASFYAHFDIVKEGDTPPPPLTIRVCDSVTCAMKGAESLFQSLNSLSGEKVRIVSAPCMGRCAAAPVCQVGKRSVDQATKQRVCKTIEKAKFTAIIPAYASLENYQINGGYSCLKALKSGKLTSQSVIETLSNANLKGLGGAGFPAGRKWQIVNSFASPRLMTVNGDEGEPGTFKDRHCIETNPHQFLEGALIAATAVEAERVYIYIRDEFPACLEILTKEIKALEENSLVEKDHIELRRGAGSYICGEESAMIESIEGKRGLPRHRPPYIAEVGLFGRPTLNHNVETLYWIPPILEHGANWFAEKGINGAKGLRSWSISGRVNNPGVIEAPAGSTAHSLIELAGGMEKGHTFKAYLPGGASGGILPASLANLPLDFDSLVDYDCFVGSHAIIILSDQDDIPSIARNLLAFFKHESCGQCTPCRVGCEKALALMKQPQWDAELLEELSVAMQDASICGLGQAAPNPIRSVLRFFSQDIS